MHRFRIFFRISFGIFLRGSPKISPSFPGKSFNRFSEKKNHPSFFQESVRELFQDIIHDFRQKCIQIFFMEIKGSSRLFFQKIFHIFVQKFLRILPGIPLDISSEIPSKIPYKIPPQICPRIPSPRKTSKGSFQNKSNYSRNSVLNSIKVSNRNFSRIFFRNFSEVLL